MSVVRLTRDRVSPNCTALSSTLPTWRGWSALALGPSLRVGVNSWGVASNPALEAGIAK
ncbi:MAG: hypothetical protein KGI98_13630 [Euryarchaeota archaeon]|nr:hypothetical protein [Euryarchaeota archaeon]